MSQQPILTLQPSPSPQEDIPKATPHLLPCRVHHSGPVEPVDSFWDPKTSENGTSTAYFRGRKLQGTTVALPAGYRGLVASVVAPEPPAEEEPAVIDLEASSLPQGALQPQAEFDEMVVWGHEAAVDPAADPYLRAAGEWLAVAEKIHSVDAPAAKKK